MKKTCKICGEIAEMLSWEDWHDGNIDEETVTKMLGALLMAQWGMKDDDQCV
nr:MAG TPA: Protein of unknown function (DUF983) [Caudoviricetes sp.]